MSSKLSEVPLQLIFHKSKNLQLLVSLSHCLPIIFIFVLGAWPLLSIVPILLFGLWLNLRSLNTYCGELRFASEQLKYQENEWAIVNWQLYFYSCLRLKIQTHKSKKNVLFLSSMFQDQQDFSKLIAHLKLNY